MSRLRLPWRDETGTSVVELALIAPILTGLLFAIVDLGKGFNEKLLLEQVAQRAIEKAMQGVQADPQTGIFSTLRSEAATEAGVQESAVVVKYWLECAGVSQFTSYSKMDEDYKKVCGAGVQYSRFLQISLEKAYAPTFRMPWMNVNAQGNVIVKARAGLRVQ
ncbi:TadE/TadG family type IV pilus assembly protein [Sphingomonas kaistensis]|uniref:TadE/TadG family type IV pilus assembly protein n=1 Tax=Sphingomonas kaistensis TaxID=298708 RepID=A0ABZ2G6C9_9SPHN